MYEKYKLILKVVQAKYPTNITLAKVMTLIPSLLTAGVNLCSRKQSFVTVFVLSRWRSHHLLMVWFLNNNEGSKMQLYLFWAGMLKSLYHTLRLWASNRHRRTRFRYSHQYLHMKSQVEKCGSNSKVYVAFFLNATFVFWVC